MSPTIGAGGGRDPQPSAWRPSRSCDVPSMDAPLLTDDFREFLRLLNANRVEYLVVGGYAVGLHGYPRATVDLDIWIHAAPENADRVLASVRAFGFDLPALESALFVKPDSIVRFGVPPFRIEVMTSIDGVAFTPCRERAVMFEIDGLEVPVIALDDLKVNKRAAGRHQDLADLDNLP
jgi:predicted nucleotidyltransferase